MQKLLKGFDYGTQPNSYDIAKAVALLAMIIDHAGYYLMPDQVWLRVVGRLAFPIFLFLVGYSQSYRFHGWLLAGAVTVLISKLTFGYPLFPLLILFSILLWRVVMGYLHTRPHILNDVPMLWVAMLVFYLPSMILVEYGTLGLMFAVLGWHTRNGRNDRSIRMAWLFTLLFWVGMQSMNFGFTMLQTVVLLTQSTLLCIALMQFRLTPVPVPKGHGAPSPTLAEMAIIFCARNTLLLYVLHVVLFQYLNHLYFPELHGGGFQWIYTAPPPA